MRWESQTVILVDSLDLNRRIELTRYFQFDVEDEDSSDNYNKNEDALHHSNHCEWDYVRFVFF